MSIAALPMYDFPELRDATDTLWYHLAARLRARGIDAPNALTRGPDLETIWTNPELLLAQTCGYPLVTTLAGHVTLVATPRYTAPGCDGPLYRSVVVVRATDGACGLSDLRGRRCAINDVHSNSGMNVLRAAVAPLANNSGQFFSDIVMTGAHAASAQAVGDGEADIAAIDCVTWAHLLRFRPAVTRALRVLDWTQATAGLPLITSLCTSAGTADALIQALQDLTCDPVLVSLRRELLLEGVSREPLSVYGALSDLAVAARILGYPILR